MKEAGMKEAGMKGPGASARLRAFGAFWYDFVIGDDWLLAAGVVIGLAGTYLLSHAGVAAWWLLPVLVAALLPASLWKATRRRG
ncbi:MAG TPA: hypothetical protein VK586_20720 [Streptosporangiaceae bacterium]|nr:hypothetical protein [Streptosporangiaceae bacterium]